MAFFLGHVETPHGLTFRSIWSFDLFSVSKLANWEKFSRKLWPSTDSQGCSEPKSEGQILIVISVSPSELGRYCRKAGGTPMATPSKSQRRSVKLWRVWSRGANSTQWNLQRGRSHGKFSLINYCFVFLRLMIVSTDLIFAQFCSLWSLEENLVKWSFFFHLYRQISIENLHWEFRLIFIRFSLFALP